MLPRRHRITAAADFQAVTRRGARAGGPVVVTSALLTTTPVEGAAWRCGFIVSKAVGNSVQRHRTQRRLRHVVRDLMAEGSAAPAPGVGLDLVVRALPAVTESTYKQLVAEVRSGMQRAVKKARRRPRAREVSDD